MTLSKCTKSVLASALLLGLLTQASLVYATTPNPLIEYEDDPLNLNRFESFQTQYHIDEIADLQVPVVVELPIEAQPKLAQFAVLDLETGDVVAHYYDRTYETEPAQVTILDVEGTRFFNLTDDKYDKAVSFHLLDDGVTQTVFRMITSKPVTSSQIRLSLPENVALPTTVQLRSTQETIIAPRRLSGTAISFPETTASEWLLTLTHTQPLRLSELTLVQDDVEKSVAQGLRFLAQPGHAYRVYADPDRSVRILTREGGDLRDDDGVQLLTTVSPDHNPLYIVADVDEDGVPDTLDNCVHNANPGQLDIDGNGRGDACDDFDRDGRINSEDNCPDDPNRRQQDEDGDGIGDVCDAEESRFTEKYVWVPWVGLGTASFVILGMFLIMLRREDVAPAEATENDQSE